jgi:hypothetical protein
VAGGRPNEYDMIREFSNTVVEECLLAGRTGA